MDFGNTELLTYFITILHILYFLILFGITLVEPQYISFFDKMVQLFIVIFLLYRFGFNKTKTITQFDNRVIFYCAFFLLVNLIATQFAFSNIFRNIIKL